jgi:hypothetical protein
MSQKFSFSYSDQGQFILTNPVGREQVAFTLASFTFDGEVNFAFRLSEEFGNPIAKQRAKHRREEESNPSFKRPLRSKSADTKKIRFQRNGGYEWPFDHRARETACQHYNR